MARAIHAAPLPSPDAPARPVAVVALTAPAATLATRLAELSAQHGPFGLPIARGAFRAVVATDDPRAEWRYGRALPFPVRILHSAEMAPRAAALALIAAEAPWAVLVLPAPGVPIPHDLVHSLLSGMAPSKDAAMREVAGARHLALRPALAMVLPEGQEAAALMLGGFRVARAMPAPEAPPPPRRPGMLERWVMRRLELA